MPSRDKAVTSRMMSRVKSKNTKPEMTVRRALFRLGLRYRIHDSRLPGRPDIVFVGPKLVVFIDGDFWHGAGWRERGHNELGEQFPTNREFWVAKIQENQRRDARVDVALQDMGWTVIRVMESEVKADLTAVVNLIAAAAHHGE